MNSYSLQKRKVFDIKANSLLKTVKKLDEYY